MKILIASDLHGSAYWTERLVEAIDAERPDRVVLLGDLLYHGPRNDLPRLYAPKRVIALLNGVSATYSLTAVRGNCEAEVDQMVLDFPCLADSAMIEDDRGRTLFITHGHIYGPGLHNSVENVPDLPEGSALIYGHTHIKVNEPHKGPSGLWLFNPGSVSIPKDEGNSYGIYESDKPIDRAFRHVRLDAGSGNGDVSARDASTLSDAREEFQELVETIWRLRQPDGCPWDREQTHTSIAKNMIEEAYEAVDCMEAGDMAHLREELGDVLMQVVLHAQIAADAGEFTCADVARDINEKLIRRHPHVFGEATVTDAKDVLDIWDQVKLAERSAKGEAASQIGDDPEGLLEGVPRSLPALLQAQKISRKAAAVGFEWDSTEAVWEQVAEERIEFEAEPAGSPEREMEFGDLLFSLVNVARREGIDAESALRASAGKFRSRWAKMEKIARDRGTALESLSTRELNALWEEVK